MFNYDYGNADLTEKGRDKLARTVIRRFRESVTWASSERVSGKSLHRALNECHDQINGILDPGDREIAKTLGVENAHINLTAMKCGVVQAFLQETLQPIGELPWTISPTPIPDLSERAKFEVLQLVKTKVFAEGFVGDLEELVRQAKIEVKRLERERSEEAARNMSRLMYDQCVEGFWNEALSAFIFNFVVYPFAVMLGPVPTRGPRLGWAKGDPTKPGRDHVRIKDDTYYKWEAVNPYDFWFSPDSRNAQCGTGVFVRRRMTRQQLLLMTKIRSYITSQVEGVLRDVETADKYNLRWLSSPNPDQPDDQLIYWSQCSETIDALVHYGRFSGRELGEYGITGLEELKQYDATVTLVGGYTVQVFIAPDPSVNIRPIFTASFYKETDDRIPGCGIAQRIRGVEKAFLASLRYLVRNMANSSEPNVEVDYKRLAENMAPEQMTKFSPGTIWPVDNDPMTVQYPAVRFYNVPSVMDAYVNLMQYFMDLAHLATNIPAALHGTAVGSGANRTFRGAAMLQGNAVKSIQSAIKQIDDGVFKPMGELLYNYNMLYEDDIDVKGDSKVVAQGVAGLLAKELAANDAMDVLQIIAAVGGQLGATAGPAVDWAIQTLFRAKRMPAEIADRLRFIGSSPDSGAPPGAPPAGGGPAEVAGPPSGGPPGPGVGPGSGMPAPGPGPGAGQPISM
jgi:hypothetical protein